MASTSAAKRVVVIGAGWAGLAAAKTYLEIDPKVQLTIFDSERHLGGVWNKDRCFPGFLADSPTGLFDLSDLPMRDAIGMKDWSDLPGDKVYEYLKAYAKKFSLVERMRLGTRVLRVSRHLDKKAWDIEIENSGEVLTFDKVIVAAGLNSKPLWPDLPIDDFEGIVMHSKDIGMRHSELTSEKTHSVTVYGGCKSAVDAIILCLDAGKKVDWVIRDTGNGPGMMVQIRSLFGIHGARFAGRWKNILSPSIFSTDTFWYRFLHSGKSRLGNFICKRIWKKASTVPYTMEPYKTKSSNMEKLMPETKDSLFFTASLVGLHGNKKFVDELHSENLLKVHRASITSMRESNIALSNGEILNSDTVVFATGWDNKSELFDPADCLKLGITTDSTNEDEVTMKYWQTLGDKAEKYVVDLLPVLKNPPPHFTRPVPHTPYRLYRYILPPSLAAQDDRSLVFLGLVTSVQTSIYAEVSALWGIGWMEGLLNVTKSKDEMDYDIAKVNAWSERRYLSRGRQRQIASVEIQDITDILMKGMGLKVYRKSNFLSETFVPIRAQDYRGIVREFLNKSACRSV
ncbi:FAD/NAD(P)-binding domain-containing protein [Mollisia scopiformis]|uniref:FAD/NAD(P)-binding domain-containing protein n=1 Tax=Mollisia scopiformis TaxID=149040 RepID=A0A194XE62_MOLSC|nr:FAD/NAD(P)-binding domain-containing protein [Mollisia scopiformis]KUJ18470.1 FAD/NAD(P)-binding domain-containing protein [Mollisia scopiformis]